MTIDTNRILLTGRVGQRPELKTSTNGSPYVRLSLAVHKIVKAQAEGTKEPLTQWHQIMVWGNQAEYCARFLNKGSPVLVEGALESRSYVVDGNKRYSTTVLADRVQFLTGKNAERSLNGNLGTDNGGGPLDVNTLDASA